MYREVTGTTNSTGSPSGIVNSSRNPRSSHIWLLYSYTLYACRRCISNVRIGLCSVDLRFGDSSILNTFCGFRSRTFVFSSKALCVPLILRMAGRVDCQDEILPYLYERPPRLTLVQMELKMSCHRDPFHHQSWMKAI